MLHYALGCRKPEIVKLLLDYGADPEVGDQNGVEGVEGMHDYDYDDTCLMHAIEDHHECMVAVLLSHGADMEVYDCRGYSLLMLAAENDMRVAFRVLLERGADVKYRNWYGDTAKSVAKEKYHSEIIEYIDEYLLKSTDLL